ncbi:MAG: SMP-30/gluconolactonase/LRE family protein [Synoicihabitans sp.]
MPVRMKSKLKLFLTLIAFGSGANAAVEIVASNHNPDLKIAGSVAFTEGPAWHPPSGTVFFTDIVNNRIMRSDTKGKADVYRTPSGRANGLAFDHQNRLIACESGPDNRRITRTEHDGSITVLTATYRGKRYNSPNDLVVASDGAIYFTDPRYGARTDMQIQAADGSAVEGVYRIDPDGTVSMVLELEVHRPNGIALSADEKYLFVADNANGRPQGNRVLWRFELNANGSLDLRSQTSLFDWGNSGSDRGPDGMAVGKDGKLYVTAGLNFSDKPHMADRKFPGGIYVIDPSGKGLLDFISIPVDDITNCTFGGEDGNTLFITAGHRLFSLPIE